MSEKSQKPEADPKKKLKLSKQVSVSLQKPIEIENKSQSSVEIKRNSKGNVEFFVKVYNDDESKAKEIAQKIYDDLNKKYKFE